ncbi:MAG: hypothetical protein ABJM06_12980 [Gilvibacter sp.]
MSLSKTGKVSKNAFLLWNKTSRIILPALLLMAMSSCQYFETTKVDSEDLYKQEIETISWDEVDQYPLFLACDESATKAQQRICFQQQLSKAILENLASKQLQVYKPMLDTIHLDLNISDTGEIKITSMQVDSIVSARLPEIAQWLQEGIDNAPRIGPALKRGIPVNTSMTLPIILRSKED